VSNRTSNAGDLKWHVSRTCDTGACIKVTRKGDVVIIGSTNEPDGPFSEFTVDEFRHFLAGAKQGDFDGIS
jgi:Domain of unknown function (DUF397)